MGDQGWNVMDRMFVSPTANSYVEVPIPNMIIFVGRDFMEVKLSEFIRVGPRYEKINKNLLLSPYKYEITVKKQPSLTQEESSHQESNQPAPCSGISSPQNCTFFFV